jgi:pyridoxamine 5'-phosphate oxidase family protein
MSAFSPTEVEYLRSQRLGRLATVGPDGQPHVVPVSFRYNAELDAIEIGGHGFAKRKKYRDVLGNPRVAFVVDDIASLEPWKVRGIEIRGEAEVLATGGNALGPGFAPEMFRIKPRRQPPSAASSSSTRRLASNFEIPLGRHAHSGEPIGSSLRLAERSRRSSTAASAAARATAMQIPAAT